MLNPIAKILLDGTQIAVTDPRTDHAAVLFEDGTMVYAHSIGQGPDPHADANADDEPFDSQQDAEAGVPKFHLLGFDDWKLGSIQDYERYVLNRGFYNPAVDPNLFPNVKPEWHWSSTPAAWSSASAWLVGFGSGGVDDYHRYGSGFALAVRRAGQ